MAVWEAMIIIFWFFLCMWGFRFALLALIGVGAKGVAEQKLAKLKHKFHLEDDGG